MSWHQEVAASTPGGWSGSEEQKQVGLWPAPQPSLSPELLTPHFQL